MITKYRKLYLVAGFSLFAKLLIAQDQTQGTVSTSAANYGEVHGNIQVDAQYYLSDSLIGAPKVPEKFLTNGFAVINYTKGKFNAGIRYEHYLNVMQGFPSKYTGTGIPYRFAQYTIDELEFTLGNFYEQFGSGLPLRTYEERGLGIDNAFDGLRLKYTVYKGIYLKALVAKQRYYFEGTRGLVRAFDGEMQFNELFKTLQQKKTHLSVGGSFVSKYEKDEDPRFVLPENVGLGAGRLSLSRGNFSINGEYTYKFNDPSTDNGYIYKDGDAILLQTAYSVKGFGLSLSAKRIDNMSFRSNRTAGLTELAINFNPLLSKVHTYGLLTFYPYASQNNGEIAYQGEMFYKIKSGSWVGGKYGADVSINYSVANGLKKTLAFDELGKRLGYSASYIKLGELYYQDFNVELVKKLTPHFKLTAIYANQIYNYNVIRNEPGVQMVFAHIGVLDMTYKIKDAQAVRWELQHLYTEQDQGSWAHALFEYTANEHWFIVLLDQYNYGNETKQHQLHYYNVQVGYIKNTTRLTVGYGKQRAGIFCAGGVCRYVPASNGVGISLTSSF